MTAATELFHELTRRGVTLIPAGEHIRVKPRDLLTDDDRERIRTCKPDLLALLAGGPPDDVLSPVQRGQAKASPVRTESAIPCPDDPLSNEVRARLLLWGAPLGWPSLVEIGLGSGGGAWTEWLLAASLADLKQAILAAVRAEHTTLALDMEALRLWPGSAIVREKESGT